MPCERVATQTVRGSRRLFCGPTRRFFATRRVGFWQAGGATMLQPLMLRLTIPAVLLLLSPQPDQLCSSSRCRTPRGGRGHGSEMNHRVFKFVLSSHG